MKSPMTQHREAASTHITRYFEQGVAQVMRPFNPGNVRVSVNHELGYERTIFVQIGSLHSHPCKTNIDLHAEPYTIVDNLIKAVQTYYAEIYTEPEDHIVLGEN